MGWSIHHPQGLIHYDSRKAFEGYTLFSVTGGTQAYLIDMDGRVCHRWKYEAGLAYGFFLENGNLLMRTRGGGGTTQIGGAETGIIELDWDGNVVWEYWHALAHHDFERLANGNTLIVFYDEVPAEVAARVAGGRGSRDEKMFGDTVREITPSGEAVNEWNMGSALDPESDAICPLEGRHQWLHQNALNLTARGDLLVSFRQIDTVGIVERDTGQFAWKWGPGEISHQHHPTEL
ncbi:MAG: aryl-sulfate sulfotransferase, partial [Rubricoccaceae bacterium]|nr:aryl-sulfate sulfotransferase [Rubricoccaceae bacterium]